jgi:hypothetical protein
LHTLNETQYLIFLMLNLPVIWNININIFLEFRTYVAMAMPYLLAAAYADLKLADRKHFTVNSVLVQKNMGFSFHATVVMCFICSFR